MIKNFISKINNKKPKVVVYGVHGDIFKSLYEPINSRFEIIGITDVNPSTHWKKKNEFEIIPPNLIMNYDFDFIIITDPSNAPAYM